MTTNSIQNRNNILDNLNYALKFAGYIGNDSTRKLVEDALLTCSNAVVTYFSEEKEA